MFGSVIAASSPVLTSAPAQSAWTKSIRASKSCVVRPQMPPTASPAWSAAPAGVLEARSSR